MQPRVARLAAAATAVPDHCVGREETAAALRRLFPAEDPALVEQIVERSGVETRYIALPLAETLAVRDFSARNRDWRRVSLELSRLAAERALARSGVAPREIDLLIDVSCTGVAIPALDVDLVPALGLRSDVRRVPITESGCAAGALALGLAGAFAERGERALIVACELCSLTRIDGDVSRTNLVASVLFGDGAAAAVLSPEGRGPRLVAAGSHLLPETSGLMGFDVGSHGLRIVLQRELPLVLAQTLRGAIEAFLARSERTVGEIGLHLVHPGGRRILDAYDEIFGLDARALELSRESLRRYGNLSSASVLTLLDLALESGARPPPGKLALLVGVGPGLSLELSLWSWDA
ncbi:MAG TPA: type III polyketide synthase [Planctomycetota bacterium]|jgi:alkylresorcinol/alkylpyrone synthase|nr:type III polyketide synthase [Planctomycetota bacterium]